MRATLRTVISATLLVGVCVALGVGLASLLLPMSPAETSDLALYLAGVGVMTIAAGSAAVIFAGRVLRLSLVARVAIVSAISILLPLAGVLIIARLMFVSTTHDLPLLVALLAASGLASGALTIAIQLRTAQRLRNLSRAVYALAQENRDGSPKAEMPDELGELSAELERLTKRLHEADRERRELERQRIELTAAVSHDLRTPLGNIRAVVEALQDRVLTDPAEIANYLDVARREVDSLDALIDDLLELARLDSRTEPVELRRVPLQDIANEVVEAMQIAARRSGVPLELVVTGEPPAIPLDGMRVERALGNLVRNALEHTPAGGSIHVEICDEPPHHVMVRVADTGEGIDPADLPHIWGRFYRADASRRHNDSNPRGAGIGLAVVASVAEAHGAATEARSAPGTGTEVTLRFPRA
jgi:signal transduction histidine kinase